MRLFRKKREVTVDFDFEGITAIDEKIKLAQPIWDEIGSMSQKERKELMSHPLEIMKFLKKRGAELTNIEYL